LADVARYSYAYSRPWDNPFRHTATASLDIPGHIMGHKKRTNKLKTGDVSYQARCKCGWGDNQWVPMRMLQWRYKEHIDERKRQEVMDV
jgi:hypothetical protein